MRLGGSVALPISAGFQFFTPSGLLAWVSRSERTHPESYALRPSRGAILRRVIRLRGRVRPSQFLASDLRSPRLAPPLQTDPSPGLRPPSPHTGREGGAWHVNKLDRTLNFSATK